MKNILLPTDFSKNSINAIHYAIKFLKDQECNFYILNIQKASSFITDNMLVVSSSTTIYKTLIDTTKKSISNILSSIKKTNYNPKHQFHSIVDYDNFIDSINQVSLKYNIDLIIMGTKGSTGLDKVLFGSNTARVMQRCNVSVLAIPDGYKYIPVDRLAFLTTDFKTFKKGELDVLNKFKTFHYALLEVLHISDENNLLYNAYDNLDFFTENFDDIKHNFINTTSKNLFNDVSAYFKRENIDILAIINKKHSFLERLFTTHTLEKFAFKMVIPLLVIQRKE